MAIEKDQGWTTKSYKLLDKDHESRYKYSEREYRDKQNTIPRGEVLGSRTTTARDRDNKGVD